MTKTLILVIVTAAVAIEQNLKEYRDNNDRFSSDLYQVVRSQRNDNFCISPLSAKIISSLATTGATGDTFNELRSVLRLPSDKSKIKELFQQLLPYLNVHKGYDFSIVNKIFVEQSISIKNDYKTTAQDAFQTEIETLNFAEPKTAAKIINDWVRNNTNDIIQNLISDEAITPSVTTSVFVNTLYFKGKWITGFFGSAFGDFNVAKEKTAQATFMFCDSYFNYYDNQVLNAEFLELPFVGDDAVFTIALPKEIDGLSSLEKSISDVLSFQPYNKYQVYVSIPKFTIETTINYEPYFASLGASIPFSNAANFSGITAHSFKIDSMAQKTVVEVNESGVTAVAATYISFGPSSIPLVKFRANRPFIYYLRHKVHGVFFVGRYIKP